MKDVLIDFAKYRDISQRPQEQGAVTEFERAIAGFGSTLRIEAFREQSPDMVGYFKWLVARVYRFVEILSSSGSIYQGDAVAGINFHLIHNYMLNAVAITGDTYDHIGITLGSILSINSFFEIVFSHPNTFTEIGEPAEESVRMSNLSGIRWTDCDSIFSSIQGQHPSPNDLAPVNLQRLAVVRVLAMIAIDFLVLHELCHILLGHTTSNENRNYAYYELGRRYDSESAYERSQALELHADGHGVFLLIDLLINFDRPQSEEWSSLFFESREEAIYWMFVSLNLLFYIMDQDNTSMADTIDHTHPHTMVRMLNAFETIRQFASMQLGMERQLVSDAWSRAISSMGTAAEVLQIPTAITEENNGVRSSFLTEFNGE